jgi:hypothetical protein
LLANDLIELGRPHSGFLQLLEGAARFDALMLADIADQEHTVIGPIRERNSRIWLVLARLDSSTK